MAGDIRLLFVNGKCVSMKSSGWYWDKKYAVGRDGDSVVGFSLVFSLLYLQNKRVKRFMEVCRYTGRRTDGICT